MVPTFCYSLFFGQNIICVNQALQPCVMRVVAPSLKTHHAYLYNYTACCLFARLGNKHFFRNKGFCQVKPSTLYKAQAHTQKIPHIMTVMSSLSRVCAVSKNIMRRVYYGGGGAQAYVMCNRTNHYKHNLRQKEMYALLRNMCASIDEE